MAWQGGKSKRQNYKRGLKEERKSCTDSAGVEKETKEFVNNEEPRKARRVSVLLERNLNI